MIAIHPYRSADLDEVVRIFFETVRHVNGRDYNPQQIEAWAPMNPDFPRWSKRMTDNVSFVARMDQEAVGFAALRADGYLDVLYVDWKHQGEGIATLLLARCEEEARKLGLKRLFTDASITARPFCEARGFRMIGEQTVELRGEEFLNYRMEKEL